MKICIYDYIELFYFDFFSYSPSHCIIFSFVRFDLMCFLCIIFILCIDF